MIRILFAAVLGALTTLLILSATGSTKFTSWAIGFGITASILLPLMLVGLFLKKSATTARLYRDAQENGRIKAALILDRRQTGTYINEQPEIEFTLLVDRSGRRPFRTTARSTVSLLDMHKIVPGQLIAVAHPDPEHSNVYPMTSDVPPTPSQPLTAEAASPAAELPAMNTRASPAFPTALVSAFLISAIGAPFLVTPHPQQYVGYLLGGAQGSVARLDHPFLFEADELERSLEAMATELDTDEVLSLRITETRLDAEVQESPGSRHLDRVTVQDYEIIDRNPYGEVSPEVLEEYGGGLFNVFDIDWEAILQQVPEARELVAAQGLSNPELQSISAERSESSLAPIDVSLSFTDDRDYAQVHFTAAGEIATNQEFALLSEADRATYLYDAERFLTAAQEMLDTVGADEIIEIGNYGDRLYLEAFIATDSGVGTGHSVELSYRDGRVADVDAPTSTKVTADDRFALDDLDWVSVYRGIATGQQLMADAGAENTEPTHILMKRNDTHSRTGNETYARIYLRNALDESGYVVVYGDGTIGRVTEP